MYTPYDWQEGIGNRAQYIEGKLAQGAPVAAVSLDRGILIYTYRRQARKIYEIYDRLAFAGIGQQSDVESLRAAALEFAHREGFNRSEADVTVQRVATALSEPIKRAFGDFGAAPFVARSLFAEVGESLDDDLYYTLDYDGDYSVARRYAVIAGTGGVWSELSARTAALAPETSPETAMETLDEVWRSAFEVESLETLKPEALLVERSNARENRFRLLTPEEF